MLRSITLATCLALAMVQPGIAMDTMMKCDHASMMKLETEMDAMSGSAMKRQKDMAMKEMAMAKKSMNAHKTKDCMMHMDNAMKAMKKKG